uniref:CTP synthase n=1 Tax=Fervidicoccus fontis TaxID=683846 RepID=A0A7J3ZL78_9CREN
MKVVFITGGVMSSVGKGITTASMAMLFSRMGYNVTAVKIDPYINVDAGTMNPYMHGEVFVTEDGGETDLDLGHYERFLGKNLTKRNNITTGKIYQKVIERERRGEYLGQTVQIIPHVTDEIKREIIEIGREWDSDLVFVEIGGTVGDIESLPFLEAARQMLVELGSRNVAYVHTAYVPLLPQTREHKTKPLQHSVNELRRIGIQPNIIIGRSPKPFGLDVKKKIALYSTVPVENVICNPDVSVIYEVPLILEEENLTRRLNEILGLPDKRPYLDDWREFVDKVKSAWKPVRIGMIGKYTKLPDSYISIREAIVHASAYYDIKPTFYWIETTDIELGKVRVDEALSDVDGGVVLPGFGSRGAEGKIQAIKYLRENDVPTLGICFGLQMSVVEFARSVLGLEQANSTEIDPNTPHPVITLLEEQKDIEYLGGTMRLGAYDIELVPGTKTYSIYGRRIIRERHRHRYEVNPKYIDDLENAGLVVSGWSVEGRRVEFIELKNHRFYIATQSHPEFRSRPLAPSPVFSGFIVAMLNSCSVR